MLLTRKHGNFCEAKWFVLREGGVNNDVAKCAIVWRAENRAGITGMQRPVVLATDRVQALVH